MLHHSAECYMVHWSVTSLCWVLHGSLKCYITLLSVTWFTEVLHHSAECYMVHWSVTLLCWVLHGSLKCYITLLSVTCSLKCYITLQSVTWFTEVLQDSSEVVRDFTEVWHYWSVAGLQWSGTWHHWSVITLLKWCRTPVVLCATLHWNVGEAFPINASGASQNSTEPVILAKGLCYRIGHHVSCVFWIWHWIIIITPTSHHPLLNAVDLCWCHHQLCFDWLLISLIYMVRSFLLIQVYSVSSFLLISVDSVIHIV